TSQRLTSHGPHPVSAPSPPVRVVGGSPPPGRLPTTSKRAARASGESGHYRRRAAIGQLAFLSTVQHASHAPARQGLSAERTARPADLAGSAPAPAARAASLRAGRSLDAGLRHRGVARVPAAATRALRLAAPPRGTCRLRCPGCAVS